MEKEAALLGSGKENEDLCSFYEDELIELYSSCGSDTTRESCDETVRFFSAEGKC